MGKPLILIDVDRTIINTEAEITDPTLAIKISQMVKKGWEIGLCSDRPITELEHFQGPLNINGPLVGEMGATILLPHSDRQKLLLPSHTQHTFSNILMNFLAFLIKSAQEHNLYITLGRNSIDYEQKILKEHVLGTRYMYIDIARTQSIAMSMRTFGPAGPLRCGEVIEDLSTSLVSLFNEFFEPEKHTNPPAPMLYVNPEEWGCIIMHHPDNGKHKAGQVLLNEHGYDRIFMIGDTTFDDLKDAERVVQLGVANAWNDYKELCQFTSRYEYSSGVAQCLIWIESQ